MTDAPVKTLDRHPGGSPQWLVVAALALAGFALGQTPLAERADLMLLDRGFAALRAIAPKPAPDSIVIVGIDEATRRTIAQRHGSWHAPLGEALRRIASARPRAIALDILLPDHTAAASRAGLERTLQEGLLAARSVDPLVLALAVNARGEAKALPPPYLAVVGVDRLGLTILGRDVDGVTRRYSLALPTQDGAFPTLIGRLCAGLSGRCRQGVADYSLGNAYPYLSLERVLEASDAGELGRLLGGRIVFVGEIGRLSDRIAQPVNLAAWEAGGRDAPGRDAPGVLAHAQALRTALYGRPVEAVNPVVGVILVSAAALVFVASRWRRALLGALAAGLALLAISLLSLGAGLQVPVSAALATCALAAMARAGYDAWWPRESG